MNTAFRVMSHPVVLAVALGLSGIGVAASADQQNSADTAQQLETVVVTGSLIPQLQSEAQNFTPVTVITAEDLQQRGFSTVADALQHASFSTGAVQGPQYSGGFT
ncbi:MAG TPA: hypothetical protein VGL28_05465, partial [Steroidobacteraceae bacterium]